MQFVASLGEFLEKAALDEPHWCSLLVGKGGEEQVEGALRPGGRDVEESSFLLKVPFPVDGPLVREKAVGQPDDEDVWKLQPFGLVDGGQAEAALAGTNYPISRFRAKEDELRKHFMEVFVFACKINQAL